MNDTPKKKSGFAGMSLEKRKELGKKGGNLTKEHQLAKDPFYYENLGRKGGYAMLKKYGPEFFSKIGKYGRKRPDGTYANQEEL